MEPETRQIQFVVLLAAALCVFDGIAAVTNLSVGSELRTGLVFGMVGLLVVAVSTVVGRLSRRIRGLERRLEDCRSQEIRHEQG